MGKCTVNIINYKILVRIHEIRHNWERADSLAHFVCRQWKKNHGFTTEQNNFKNFVSYDKITSFEVKMTDHFLISHQNGSNNVSRIFIFFLLKKIEVSPTNTKPQRFSWDRVKKRGTSLTHPSAGGDRYNWAKGKACLVCVVGRK